MKLTGSRVDEVLAMLARRGGGVFALRDTRASGIDDQVVHRRSRSVHITRLLPGVFCHASTPITRDVLMHAVAAWLPESAFSHDTAASLYGIRPPSFPIEVKTASHQRCREPRIRLHRVDEILSADVAQVARFRTTSPTRTLLDLARRLPPAALEDVLDEMRRQGLVELPRLREHLEQGPRLPRGSARLLALVGERDGTKATESRLEDRVPRLLRAHGMPVPEAQYEIRDAAGAFIGRMDFAYPLERVIVECDSYQFHSSKAAFMKDRVRWNRATAAGYRLVFATWENTQGDGRGFLEELRRALEGPKAEIPPH